MNELTGWALYNELNKMPDTEFSMIVESDKPYLKIIDYEFNTYIFHEKQPFFYDRTGQFWKWDKSLYKWELSDDYDMLNAIDKAIQLGGSTSQTGHKNNYLNAFKKIGRSKIPKSPDPYCIQFKNKIVNILTGEITKATPEYFHCNPIPHELGTTSDTPVMDKIFTQWVGEEYVKTLYQILAYCIIPEYPIHRMFCFIGNGLNGKSKFLELIKRFIGIYNTTSTELDKLLVSRFEITRLHKKLLCVMGETNFSEMKKTSILKQLTGGDLIGFEYKGGKHFEDINYAKIILSTNNLPTTSDKTDGFYRRWMIIDFKNQFSEKFDILREIPDEEYNNLTNKSVVLLKNLLKDREFHNEGSIEERKKRFEDRSNPVQKFWEDNVVESCDDHISKTQFKRKLEDWCTENRFRKFSDMSIAKFMKEKIIDTGRVQGDWFTKEGEKPRYMAWLGIKWSVT